MPNNAMSEDVSRRGQMECMFSKIMNLSVDSVVVLKIGSRRSKIRRRREKRINDKATRTKNLVTDEKIRSRMQKGKKKSKNYTRMWCVAGRRRRIDLPRETEKCGALVCW